MVAPVTRSVVVDQSTLFVFVFRSHFKAAELASVTTATPLVATSQKYVVARNACWPITARREVFGSNWLSWKLPAPKSVAITAVSGPQFMVSLRQKPLLWGYVKKLLAGPNTVRNTMGLAGCP